MWNREAPSKCERYGDWNSGECLIRRSHFVEWVEQFADDIGAIDANNAQWIVIDWQKTADNVEVDYMSVDFGGVEYLMRA